ncbi:MAG: hypothetical protein R2864_15115 [Syntrophotaleaceae bacterium]
MRPAHGVEFDEKYFTTDDEFKRIIAILRLAVPYTGLILTARENPELRRELMSLASADRAVAASNSEATPRPGMPRSWSGNSFPLPISVLLTRLCVS